MKTFKILALGVSAASILTLAACGEGYEAVPYSSTPYGDTRTAGKGVEYVRIKMMKEKGTVLETKTVTTTAPAAEIEKDAPPAAEPVKPADDLFNKKQKK